METKTELDIIIAERDSLRKGLEGIADVPDGYHDCSDYERGYGDARAAARAMARVALKNAAQERDK